MAYTNSTKGPGKMSGSQDTRSEWVRPALKHLDTSEATMPREINSAPETDFDS